jgi:hypothetical protein
MWMRVLANLGTVLVLSWQSTDAAARDICWIERVKRTAAGVDVYFFDTRNVTVNTPTGKQQVYLAYPVNADRVRLYGNETPVEAVPARLGDRLFSANTPHDSCGMTVVLKEGKIGLEASASMQMGGLPPSSVKKFIPAE